LHWWRKLWPGSSNSPLTPAHTSSRVKSYVADSGYEYNYSFRSERQEKKGVRHYIFQVGERSISVVQDDAIFAEWSRLYERELTPQERFGIANMALRDAMDNAVTPQELPRQVRLNAADVERISLDLDL
jgi:hypothetical protein